MTSLKWIWDWKVEIMIGFHHGIPVIWFKWTQRTPPPWKKP